MGLFVFRIRKLIRLLCMTISAIVLCTVAVNNAFASVIHQCLGEHGEPVFSNLHCGEVVDRVELGDAMFIDGKAMRDTARRSSARLRLRDGLARSRRAQGLCRRELRQPAYRPGRGRAGGGAPYRALRSGSGLTDAVAGLRDPIRRLPSGLTARARSSRRPAPVCRRFRRKRRPVRARRLPPASAVPPRPRSPTAAAATRRAAAESNAP